MFKDRFVSYTRRARVERIKLVNTALKITVCALAALFVILSVALFVDLLGMKIKYTLEAGDPLPSAEELSGIVGAEYDFGNYSSDFTKTGEYTIHIVDGSRKIKVKLTVVDTKAPTAELITLNANINGPFPEAIDFFRNVEDASSYSAVFKNSITPSELGEYEIHIELSDEHGNKKRYKTSMTVIEDNETPTISGPAIINSYLGEAVAYTKDITVSDNCFGEVTLSVDTSGVNVNKVGVYKVKYTATDKAGNTATRTITLNILAQRITRDMLMEEIGALASSLNMNSSMSKEELCRLIYGYVNSPNLSAANATIVFTDESNTDRSDWIREAYLTLERGSGDCYSYFAVSKAFFEYFGIENMDIERAKGVTTQQGTHFWSMVNIGTKESPRWYYYDATRLAAKHRTGSGCLFTEEQLLDYNTKVKVGFLTFDHTGYPEISKETINTSYSW